MTWTELTDIFRAFDSFLISSHINPDGDCIGSQLAVYWYIRSLGKKVSIHNYDPVPRKLQFLTNSGVISTATPVPQADVLVVLDASNPDRLGWDVDIGNYKASVNIDHHRDNKRFADVNIVDSSASATAQILYQFFEENKITYPPHVAESLYTALMTDTGGFRFSNTNGNVLRISASLADRGADCADIYQRTYASHSPQGLLLRAKIWSTLTFYFDNKVCSMEMPMSLVDRLGATNSESEGMADNTIAAEGIEVGMMIKYSDAEVHFSLRSNGTVDVGRIARGVAGGGGHTSAAGCTLHMPVDEAKAHMLEIIRRELA